MREPNDKRAVAFIDGQNLFHAAKAAFGFTEPSYDVVALAAVVCSEMDWALQQVRFYTGVPQARFASRLREAWNGKLARMSERGVVAFTRQLRYAGNPPVGREKGIDVRIALDVMRLAHLNHYDVALIFSQDQDFSEIVDDIKEIASEQRRWIKIASAYPKSPQEHLNKGIFRTDWIAIERETYTRCLERYPFYSPQLSTTVRGT